MLFPSTTTNGIAREAALQAITRLQANPTSLVEYRSSGSLLIIGPEDRAMATARGLKDRLCCTLLITEGGSKAAEKEELECLFGHPRRLTGYLGAFRITLATLTGEVELSFDLVLDLGSPSLIRREIAPLGYYPLGENPEALNKALTEVPTLVGEFEKPTFYHYNADICAHGRSGLKGCTRCLDVCPTEAITSLQDLISVDPFLCQGAGSCATACPTGAISYAYPRAADTLTAMREMLEAYRKQGGHQACLLFHDAETGKETVARLAHLLPERVIPFELNELGAAGMEVWLVALAYGATEVVLLGTAAIAPSVLAELQAQLQYARALLAGMGYGIDRLRLLGVDDEASMTSALTALLPQPELIPATFATFNEKRGTLRMAIDHLYKQAPRRQGVTSLPLAAPFGEVRVDRDACTLCMGCVSVCPTRALTTGNGLPQLNFSEDRCVQCGLCRSACPEDAITLVSRYVYDRELRWAPRVLNEEPPLHCITCGKPFATRRMIEKMEEKLHDHWMFQNGEAMRRLRMCGDCRVRNMLETGEAMALSSHPPAARGRDD